MAPDQRFLAENDPILKALIQQLPRPDIASTHAVFHDLMSCIVEQQIHYRSTKRIFAKALERAAIDRLTVDNFPAFEKHALSHIKLAMGKYEAMLGFLEYWKNNALDFAALSDQEVVRELSALQGIGQWTIDMVLLFTLNRPNVFPADDYHLKQSMVALYGLNEKVKLKAQMVDIAEHWGAHKSLAVLYLLAHKKSKTGLGLAR